MGAWSAMGVNIRATHPDGFRSGEWAEIVDVRWVTLTGRNDDGRACYAVRFVDGREDVWPVNDSSDPYEFRPGRRKAVEGL